MYKLFKKHNQPKIYRNPLKKCNLFYYLFLAILIFCFQLPAQAANDDPGAGRLSGSNIPAEFYEHTKPTTTQQSSILRRYGDAETLSPYTGKAYKHRTEYVDRSITHGIDVSEWQKQIDWNKVKAAGIKYAFIRVGYRGSTEGKLSEDKYFRQNIENALAAGVEVGVYIFSQATTKEEAREEATYLIERIKDYNITFPVVLDYEFTSGTGRLEAAKLSKDAATEVCLAFCETVASAGYTPMVYANPDMLNNHLNPDSISSQYLVWLANYTTETSYTGKYDYWQYSSDGTVDGITGRVDMNFYYGTDIANAAITPVAEQIYTGGNIETALTIIYQDRLLTAGTDYTVTYANNSEIGTATVTVTGKNTFYGTQTLEFRILPRQMTPVKAKKKSDDYLTLSWNEDNGVTGYQIFRANAIDGNYKKIATISNQATKTYKDKNLKNGQCYYYKIRGYKTVNGEKWFGAFSEIKSIYTKTGFTRNALTKNNAALYVSAAIDGTPIIVPEKGETLSVIYATKDSADNPWYRVICETDEEDYEGFVRGNKVTITQIGKVTSKDVNVRKSNSTSSKVLTKLNKNKKVTILKTKKKSGITWYQITFKKNGKTYKGWISGQYVKII